MNKSVEERFNEKVEKTAGCWLWKAALKSGGYGSFYYKGQTHAAHRVAYELYIEPIAAGLELDHLCRVTACVNPHHLEPVSKEENLRRSRKFRRRSPSKSKKNSIRAAMIRAHVYGKL